jgi:hypothetical protein
MKARVIPSSALSQSAVRASPNSSNTQSVAAVIEAAKRELRLRRVPGWTGSGATARVEQRDTGE